MIKKIILFSLLIYIVFFLTGCGEIEPYIEKPAINIRLNEEFSLKENQTAFLEEKNVYLELKNIIFSPCPKDVVCVWSGLGAKINVSDGKDSKEMLLTGQKAKYKIFGIQINILNIEEEIVFFKITEEKIIEEEIQGECLSDSDCIPASCCHPKTCVSKDKRPDCRGILCTMECRPGTLDCGQGACRCVNNKCDAEIY